MKFQAGQEVVMVRKGRIGWESEDWATKAGCILENTYIIKSTNSTGVVIEGDNLGLTIHTEHFCLLKDYPYKPYKRLCSDVNLFEIGIGD